MTFELEIDADDLARGFADLDTELDREMAHAIAGATDIVEQEARALAPKITHALEESVRAMPPTGTWQGGNLEGTILADAPHALSVHDGARPHRIVPIRASALRFVAGGQLRFSRGVNHPGNRPNPFLELALEIRAPEVEAEFASGFDLAMERAGFGR